MILVCGLGNPGKKYEKTRHNIGWMVADKIAATLYADFSSSKLYQKATVSNNDQKIVIIKPTTFMNRSGSAVRHILGGTQPSPDNLIVIHDDLDLDFGRIKIKKGGGHGGHNGIRSICNETGSNDFTRIRIGIGRDARIETAFYVLSNFKKNELELVENTIKIAVIAVEDVIKNLADAMTKHNALR